VTTKRGEPLAYLLAHLTAMPTECTSWPYGGDLDGYGRVRVDGKKVAVHVLVCTWYHGPRPAGMVASHSCGHGHLGCFTPIHLLWQTPEQDNRDRIRHGTMPLGVRNGRARLTEEQVRDIRARYAAGGVSERQLAVEFEVGRYTIRAILRRETWKHVE
jgi:hypothetical protein